MPEDSTTRKAALWVSLVFLLGAALGGMTGYVIAHQRYAVTNAATTAPPSDAARRAQKVKELTALAGLNLEQSSQVDVIIADIQSQIKTIRATKEPEISAAREKGRDRIRAILTPDQRPKFEEFIRRIDEERKRNPK
jgi:flagellar basal body-associated protein FliL